MGLFGKSRERARQDARKFNTDSKYRLKKFLDSAANKIDDEGIADDVRDFSMRVDAYPPCEDIRAAALDDRIEDALRIFFDGMFKISVDAKYLGEEAKQLKLKGNKDMFLFCSEIIDSQLFERSMFMDEKNYTPKELKQMSEQRRKRYIYKQAHNEEMESLWEVQFDVLHYTLRLKKNVYEKRVLQTQQDFLVDAAKNDVANMNEYNRLFVLNKQKIEANDKEQRLLIDQISKNEKLLQIIGASDLESMIDSKKIIDKVSKYSSKFKKQVAARKKIDDMTDEIFADFDEAQNKSTPKDKSDNGEFAGLVDNAIMGDRLEAKGGSPALDSEFEKRVKGNK